MVVTPESVTYSSDGLRIAADFYPAALAEPGPAIAFCPGYTGTRANPMYARWVGPLTEGGYSVLVPDYRGWGDSEGTVGAIYPLEQTRDVRAGLSYLESRPEVDPARLGVVGVSFGGGHAAHIAGVDSRVRAAVSIFGVGDGRSWLRGMRREYEWQEFISNLDEYERRAAATAHSERVDPTEGIMIASPERLTLKGRGSKNTTPLDCARAIIEYRPASVSADISPRAMLWMCMSDDPVVPPEQSRLMYEAALEPKRLVILPGRMHYEGYERHQATIVREILDWLERYLSPDRSVVTTGNG